MKRLHNNFELKILLIMLSLKLSEYEINEGMCTHVYVH